ncbi:MAG: tRNA preQ1(34) S-adenosylmethionine ribosyltransferase-isomerase QueA [Candidatus Obscuribacter sp.]|nr:tRNA preQ1(34) S-adenosylmethionine ribosyltransferase-isomerase QueA [Candidatus Obscuribacter sp.]
MNSAKTEQALKIEDFEYDLPPELIAQKPLEKKDQSRLFVLDRGREAFAHKHFFELPTLLRSGDLLVVNDTRVLPSRLVAQRHSGGTIKILLLKPLPTNTAIWESMVTPIKRLKPGEKLTVKRDDGIESEITVHDIVNGEDGFKRLLVDLGAKETVYELLSQVGFAPLPPYIQRDYHESKHRQEDLRLYQTIFATAPGAVAAPTAGLHFTPEVIKGLEEQGIETVRLTLHVGPGTFKPIEASVESHTIEEELYSISPATAAKINQARQEGRRIIAVGTTSLRALESAGASGQLEAAENRGTRLYVKPGFQFKIIDGLITNFHLSRSSLLVLVAAFAGRDRIMDAYREAIEKRYRFYSYGDAMLIL